MNAKNRLTVLILIMSLCSLAVSALTIAFLYQTAFREQEARLMETVQSQAKLIEAVARHDAAQHHADDRSGVLSDTLAQIDDAQRDYGKLGSKVEFVLGKRHGDFIDFLLKPRSSNLGLSCPINFDSKQAEPMKRALAGQSGTIIGRDCRDEMVMAAHEPLPELGWGIVAKVDMSKIRAPFVKAALLALMFTAVLVLAGAMLFVKISNPILRRLEQLNTELETRVEERTLELILANEQLKTEIGDRISFQKELEDSRTVFQGVVNAISDPLILLSKDLKVNMLNKAAEKYYGRRGDQDFAECPCHQMLRDRNAPCEGCQIAAAVQTGQSVQLERGGFMDPKRIEHVFVIPVQIPNRRGTEYLVRISDITEQRMLEEQAIHNEKMAQLGLMVTSIAHEINNPNAIISFNIPILRDCIREIAPIIEEYAERHPDLEICRMPYAEFREDIFRNLDNIEQASRRISEFVSNLKAVVCDRDRIREEWVHVAAMAEKTISGYRIQLGENAVPVHAKLPENHTRIWSDPRALEQILINLLLNAAQACTGEDPRIKLVIEVSDHWLDHTILTVTDSGEGMDAETLKHIFEPFFTSRSHGRGTGLGLYVCRNLVESLRGRIEVASEPGHGSTFKVILPDREQRNSKRI